MWIDHQNAIRGGFKQTAVAVLRAAQAFFYHPAFSDLSFQREGLLLQEGNGTQAFLWAGKEGVALIRDDLGVLLANLGEWLPVSFSPKVMYWIGAEERKGMGPMIQLVPEGFQADGSLLVPFHPELRNHLPKDAHAALTLHRSLDQAPYDLGEALWLWQSIHHEHRECLTCVQCEVCSPPGGSGQIQSSGLQSFLKTLSVGVCGVNKAGSTHAETRTDESTHRVQEEFVRLIELHEMLGGIHFAPLQGWSGLPSRTLVMSEGFITIGTRVCLIRSDYHVAWFFLPCGLSFFSILYHFYPAQAKSTKGRIMCRDRRKNTRQDQQRL